MIVPDLAFQDHLYYMGYEQDIPVQSQVIFLEEVICGGIDQHPRQTGLDEGLDEVVTGGEEQDRGERKQNVQCSGVCLVLGVCEQSPRSIGGLFVRKASPKGSRKC